MAAFTTAPIPTGRPELADQVAELGRSVRGRILLPGQPDYNSEIAGFQLGLRHRPDLVLVAAEAADVAAAVTFAAANGLPVVAQATGHGLSAPLQGGVLISTRQLDRVQIRPATSSAHIEAGVRWEQVMIAAETHGLAPLSGSSPGVGAVSYTLGGGIGALSRQYGYASDHVRSIEVVTADGRLRMVTAESEPDLFYALRGGRANFGIVTSMEIGLVPVAKLYGGDFFYDGERAADILSSWRTWTAGLPEEFTSSISVIQMPGIEAVPEPIRGRLIVHLCLVYTGSPAEGAALVAPIIDVAPPLLGSMRELPFSQTASIYQEPPFPHAYYGSNAMLRELSDEAIAAAVATTDPQGPVQCIIDIRHLGGAMSRPPAIPSAAGQRDARYALRVLTVLDGYERAAVQAVHDRLYDEVAANAVGRSANFMYGLVPTPEQVQSFYDPDAYARLIELKAVYDPHNLFRTHHPLPSANGAPAR